MGVTFIDHEKRCVLNGSRLGKEYSANVFNDLFGGNREPQTQAPIQDTRLSDVYKNIKQPNTYQDNSHTSDSVMGGLFSILTPEPESHSKDEQLLLHRKKKKRKHGRRM